MIRRVTTTRRQVIEALTTAPTFNAAADMLGFAEAPVLRKRMKRLGITRTRMPEFRIITVRP